MQGESIISLCACLPLTIACIPKPTGNWSDECMLLILELGFYIRVHTLKFLWVKVLCVRVSVSVRHVGVGSFQFSISL